jgi:hypothetical protein
MNLMYLINAVALEETLREKQWRTGDKQDLTESDIQGSAPISFETACRLE